MWGQFLKKILSPLVILSMEKTMVTMVIRELKSISRLKIFRETEPWSLVRGRFKCIHQRFLSILERVASVENGH